MTKPTLRKFLLPVLFGLALFVLIVSFFKAPFITANRRSSQGLPLISSDRSIEASQSLQDPDLITETVPPSRFTAPVFDLPEASAFTNPASPSTLANEQTVIVQKPKGAATNGSA